MSALLNKLVNSRAYFYRKGQPSFKHHSLFITGLLLTSVRAILNKLETTNGVPLPILFASSLQWPHQFDQAHLPVRNVYLALSPQSGLARCGKNLVPTHTK